MTDGQRFRATFRRGDTDAMRRMADAEVKRSRAVGVAAGEVEGVYGLARVALRGKGLEQATGLAQRAPTVAQRAGERRLEERPRHVLAAVARLSSDHTRARDLYEVGIEPDGALGLDERVHSECQNSALVEMNLGTVERARRLIAESRDRVFQGGCRDFLRYLERLTAPPGTRWCALASADGHMTLAARLIGFTDQALPPSAGFPTPMTHASWTRSGPASRPSLDAMCSAPGAPPAPTGP
ncbi:hypothetical protein ACFW9I_31075 [[Kitasatospora] papulosa]|uniref:hypothetical protein n=1 Tax=[Kitasatospora] papulosa TaxID=1464011 RepID=UPI0036C03165